ncbi:hypothetical protein [Secundilactobacillus similis]|uniref:Uncharacterized protein n=1 Tax=Secundilactobacillus similis DSM 23365 = JCM 2765 TaxID=1423804 RepID=A0A0R2FKX9_9LACO|nr:hypothetical protein [Secundilactobacillus similis]KRN25037.1 hypothetical protein FD14_GL000513 [Secundilactobacillus similis DSM 23365 = JCM 2765]
MVDLKYGAYTLVSWLILMALMVPLVRLSFGQIILYGALILVIYMLVITLIERHYPTLKQRNRVSTLPWLRGGLTVVWLVGYLAVIIVNDRWLNSPVLNFVTIYGSIMVTNVIVACFTKLKSNDEH